MTQFKLMSDLHLEFYDRKRYGIADQPMFFPEELPYDEETVLLLAGDIHLGTNAQPWIEILCKRYKAVVYILGNHEFYKHEFHKVKKQWKELDMPDNFYFLDDDVTYIDDVRIIGGTMWTRVTDPVARWRGQHGMSDYAVIKINEPRGIWRKLNVADTDRANAKTTFFIKEELRKPWKGKTIVMTHHLPHPLCVAKRFKGHALNAFYLHDCDDIIADNDIDVWCHGHTHNNVDVTVHGTRILCNPRGYHGVELNQDYLEDLIFEL